MSSGHDTIDIQSHIKVYMTVFAALAVLTIVTVAASYLDISTGEAILLALTIASIKGSLVAGYFMHLISEKALIDSAAATNPKKANASELESLVNQSILAFYK